MGLDRFSKYERVESECAMGLPTRKTLPGWQSVADVEARVRVAKAREKLKSDPNPSRETLEAMADDILGPDYVLEREPADPLSEQWMEMKCVRENGRRIA